MSGRMCAGEAQTSQSEVRVAGVAGGEAVLMLLGEHDLWTAAEVRDTLAFLLKKGANVVVDLSETSFMDTSTIHALEDSRHLALESGMKVSFQLATDGIVKRVLELTGALRAWPVYETRTEAVDAVRRAAARKRQDGSPALTLSADAHLAG